MILGLVVNETIEADTEIQLDYQMGILDKVENSAKEFLPTACLCTSNTCRIYLEKEYAAVLSTLLKEVVKVESAETIITIDLANICLKKISTNILVTQNILCVYLYLRSLEKDVKHVEGCDQRETRSTKACKKCTSILYSSFREIVGTGTGSQLSDIEKTQLNYLRIKRLKGKWIYGLNQIFWEFKNLDKEKLYLCTTVSDKFINDNSQLISNMNFESKILRTKMFDKLKF